LKKEIVIAVIIIVLVMFLFISTIEPPEPKDFVNDKTILNYTNIFFNYKIIRYPTSAEIVPTSGGNVNIGMVTDPWNLKFGSLPGNKSFIKRYIGVTNLNEKYNKINLKVYGNITPLVNFSKNSFVLNENESTVVEVNLYSDSANLGNYSGEIDIIIKVPKYEPLRVFL
jgi:hypothetical protein